MKKLFAVVAVVGFAFAAGSQASASYSPIIKVGKEGGRCVPPKTDQCPMDPKPCCRLTK